MNDSFDPTQIDSTLLLTRLDRRNPRARSKPDYSDEEVRDLLLKVASAYRQEAKTSTVELDAKDERMLGKEQLYAKFSKVFTRVRLDGKVATFRLNSTFAQQLTKQIQSEQHRQAHRSQSQDRRAARTLKSESVVNSSTR